jgi:hypothetical protein
MAKKKIKKRYNVLKHPVIGKYIDSVTKAELDVVLYYTDYTGDYRVKVGDAQEQILRGCRFGLKLPEVKRKVKFYKKLQAYLDFADGWKDLDRPSRSSLPSLFGLLKIRKGKIRKFIFIVSASQFFNNKVIDIVGVGIDNLLYLDLVNRLKEKKA